MEMAQPACTLSNPDKPKPKETRMFTTQPMRFFRAASAIALLTISPWCTRAQTPEWPTKPVRIVSPYAPGGVGDVLFRIIGPALEAKLGQRFLMDNKTGAAGNIGTGEVINAKPDGYTFLIAPTANYAVNQHLFGNLNFDPVTQLDAVVTISEAPLIAVVGPNGPGSLKELAQMVRSNPGKYNFGSPGAGSPTHLAGVSFSQLHGNTMMHIAYRGGPPMVMAMLAGDVQLAFPTVTTVATQLKAGKLKAVAVMGNQRIADLPGVPTAVESGFPELLFGNWWVLSAPKGTDPKIVNRLSAEVRAVLADPAIRAKLAEVGQTTLALGPQESTNFVRTESNRFKTLIERNGIKLEQ